MFEDRNDLNRDLGYNARLRDDMSAPSEVSWAPLGILAAFVLIGGLLWYNSGSSDNPQTAANNPPITRTAPAPAPTFAPAPAVNPAPRTTPPAQPPQ